MNRCSTNAERRAWIDAALTEDSTRSDRSIARGCGCSHSTVAAVRAELVRSGRIDPRPEQPEAATQDGGGQNGNLVRHPAGEPGPALKHGVDSPSRLVPLRLEGEQWARNRWPWLDDARVALVADLIARVELARRWLEDKGTVVANRHGRVFPVADRLEAWSKRLDDLIVRLGAEDRERGRHAVLAEVMAESEEASRGST